MPVVGALPLTRQRQVLILRVTATCHTTGERGALVYAVLSLLVVLRTVGIEEHQSWFQNSCADARTACGEFVKLAQKSSWASLLCMFARDQKKQMVSSFRLFAHRPEQGKNCSAQETGDSESEEDEKEKAKTSS
ncbi:uncharacterized protein [Macrobrachium rosenbergii]|uniref:uncharacterized protein n=1 Tax=Macrobrachium rosenbergii TaxID=79674 RepID=UPI0034D6B65F